MTIELLRKKYIKEKGVEFTKDFNSCLQYAEWLEKRYIKLCNTKNIHVKGYPE